MVKTLEPVEAINSHEFRGLDSSPTLFICITFISLSHFSSLKLQVESRQTFSRLLH